MPVKVFRNDALALALQKAKLTQIDLLYFEHARSRRFAPLPDCKLRKIACKAGFTSSADYRKAQRTHTTP